MTMHAPHVAHLKRAKAEEERESCKRLNEKDGEGLGHLDAPNVAHLRNVEAEEGRKGEL